MAEQQSHVTVEAQVAVNHTASRQCSVKQKSLPSRWDASRDAQPERDFGMERMSTNASREAVAPTDSRRSEGNSLIIRGKRSTTAQKSSRRASTQGNKNTCSSSSVNNRHRRQSRLRTDALDVAMAAAVAGVCFLGLSGLVPVRTSS